MTTKRIPKLGTIYKSNHVGLLNVIADIPTFIKDTAGCVELTCVIIQPTPFLLLVDNEKTHLKFAYATQDVESGEIKEYVETLTNFVHTYVADILTYKCIFIPREQTHSNVMVYDKLMLTLSKLSQHNNDIVLKDEYTYKPSSTLTPVSKHYVHLITPISDDNDDEV